MSRAAFIALCGALMLFALPAQAAPQFPTLSGRVVDQAGVLSPQSVRELSAMLQRHEEATSNQVVVVTLTSLQGYEIADYGYQLGRHWQIGQAGRDNGVLLIVAPNERKVRIEVGYGLEGALTDALSKNIIETVITPQFKQGDMESGIKEGVSAILAVIEGTYTPKPRGKSEEGFDFFGTLVIFSLIFSGAVRRFIPNRVLGSAVMGGITGLIGFLFYSFVVGLIAGIAVFMLQLFTGLNTGRGGGGYYGGGGYSSGGGFGGGFSGGGGSFGGGGASGGW